MKLKEIIVEREMRMAGRIPIVKSKEPLTRIKKGEEGVKSGLLAKVVRHRSRAHPNTIVKVSDIKRPEKSEIVKFFNIVLEHQDNPFFPRVHSAKIHEYYNPEYGGDQHKLVLTMERLHEINRQNIKEVAKHLFAQLGFTDEELKRIRDEMQMAPRPGVGILHDIQLSLMLEDERFRKKITEESKNPKFKEAMQLLDRLLAGQHQDLHSENWMIRLTGHGPQLVIVDPVTD